MKGNGCSALSFLCIEPTIRDNCISFCYILYFWRTGSLPWLNTMDKEEEIVQKIAFIDTDSATVTAELGIREIRICCRLHPFSFKAVY
jgi:hypothetical protein